MDNRLEVASVTGFGILGAAMSLLWGSFLLQQSQARRLVEGCRAMVLAIPTPTEDWAATGPVRVRRCP